MSLAANICTSAHSPRPVKDLHSMHRSLKSIMYLAVTALLTSAMSLPATAEPCPARELRELQTDEIQRVNQVIVRLHLAGVYDDAARPRDASRCVDAALAMATAAPSGKVRDWLLNKSLNKLAHSYASEDEAALRRFADAVRGAEAIQDPALKAHCYAKLGEKRYSSGERERGTELLRQAVVTARRVDEPISRAASFASVGKELANVGMKNEAASLTEEGLQLLETCQDGHDKSAVQAELVANFIAVGDRDKAVRMLREIPLPSDTALFDSERSSLLAFLSEQFASVGQRREAVDNLNMAFKQTPQCTAPESVEVHVYEHDYRRRPSLLPCKILVEIAGGYAGLHEWDRARSVIEKIADRRYRAMAMCKLAVALHDAGEVAAGHELLDNASAFAEEVTHSLEKMEILINVAKTQIKMKHNVKRVPDLLAVLEKQLAPSVQVNSKSENEE